MNILPTPNSINIPESEGADKVILMEVGDSKVKEEVVERNLFKAEISEKLAKKELDLIDEARIFIEQNKKEDLLKSFVNCVSNELRTDRDKDYKSEIDVLKTKMLKNLSNIPSDELGVASEMATAHRGDIEELEQLILKQTYKNRSKSIEGIMKTYREWKVGKFAEILSNLLQSRLMVYEALATGKVSRKKKMIERVVKASGDTASLFIPFGGIASMGIKKILKFAGDREMKNKLKKYMQFYEYGGAKKIVDISEEISQQISYEIGDNLSSLDRSGMNKLAKDILKEVCKGIELGYSKEELFLKMKSVNGSYDGENGTKVDINIKDSENIPFTKRRFSIIKGSVNLMEKSLKIASSISS